MPTERFAQIIVEILAENSSIVKLDVGCLEHFFWLNLTTSFYSDFPGFHEALGDTLALSVQTTKHLKKIALLKEDINDPEVSLAILLRSSLAINILNKNAFYNMIIDLLISVTINSARN